jgi:hypothetical protein
MGMRMSNLYDVRKRRQRAVSDAIREFAQGSDHSKSLLRVLQRSLTPHPKSGKPAVSGAQSDEPTFLEAGVDRLLNEEVSAELLLAELDVLDAEASAWTKAIAELRAELRTAISTRGRRPGAGKTRNDAQSTGIDRRHRGAPPCEADDEYWYL